MLSELSRADQEVVKLEETNRAFRKDVILKTEEAVEARAAADAAEVRGGRRDSQRQSTHAQPPPVTGPLAPINPSPPQEAMRSLKDAKEGLESQMSSLTAELKVRATFTSHARRHVHTVYI